MICAFLCMRAIHQLQFINYINKNNYSFSKCLLGTREAAKIFGKCKMFQTEGVIRWLGRPYTCEKYDLEHRNGGEVRNI